MCLIQPETSRAEVLKTSVAPVGITGDELPLKGEQRIEFTLGARFFAITLAYVSCRPRQKAGWARTS
jgi:hypothetical protein